MPTDSKILIIRTSTHKLLRKLALHAIYNDPNPFLEFMLDRLKYSDNRNGYTTIEAVDRDFTIDFLAYGEYSRSHPYIAVLVAELTNASAIADEGIQLHD